MEPSREGLELSRESAPWRDRRAMMRLCRVMVRPGARWMRPGTMVSLGFFGFFEVAMARLGSRVFQTLKAQTLDIPGVFLIRFHHRGIKNRK